MVPDKRELDTTRITVRVGLGDFMEAKRRRSQSQPLDLASPCGRSPPPLTRIETERASPLPAPDLGPRNCIFRSHGLAQAGVRTP